MIIAIAVLTACAVLVMMAVGWAARETIISLTSRKKIPVQFVGGRALLLNILLHVTSPSFPAELSVSSPRKLFIFII